MEELPPAPLATLDEEEENPSSEEEDAQTRCGYFSWRPKALQKLNRPPVLVACIAIYSLSLGFVVNGVNNVNASSLERRFDLSSTYYGFISSSYDITAAFFALLAGFFGSGQRKARMVAIAIFCSALGSLIMALPHFTTDVYFHGTSSDFLCYHETVLNETCSAHKGQSAISNYFYVFLLGQLLHGIGGTTMFTVGIALIDDSVMPNRTPLFLGIVYGCNILGAGMGHTIGGQLLNIYVDFDKVSDIKQTPEDRGWVGAWWLGPLIASCAQIAAALPISLFGSELPSSKKVRQLRQNQAHITSSIHLSLKWGGVRFFSSTLLLLKNPCFVFINLAMITEGMCLTGLAAFLPKFVENQYGVTAANAALYTGIAVIPAAAGGFVLGGYLANRFNLNIRQSIIMVIGLATASAVFSSSIWIRCDQQHIHGIHQDYTSKSTPSGPRGLLSPCNSMCSCDTDKYEPLCGNGTGIYFSPCYAGCTVKKGNQYSHCTCLADLDLGINVTDLTLESRSCEKSCSLLNMFIVLLFFTLFLCFMPIAPADAIQLRCVPDDYKTHAQGVKTFLVRSLGSFMGPIVVGKLLDLNCEVWREKCGETLSCWLYDQEMLVTSLYLFILLCKGFAITFCCLAFKFYRPPSAQKVESCLNEMMNTGIGGQDRNVNNEDRDSDQGTGVQSRSSPRDGNVDAGENVTLVESVRPQYSIQGFDESVKDLDV